MIDAQALAATVAFHGHLCPQLALGVRAAEVARRWLGPSGPDGDVVAIVEADSCALDAIQFLTGVTLGSGNLVHLDHGKFAFTFLRRSQGRAVRASLWPGAWAPAGAEWEALAAKIRLGTADGPERRRLGALQADRAQRVLSRPLEQLYDVAEVTVEVPERPRRHDAAVADCESCGEPTDERRLHRLRTRRLCSPCLDAALAAASPSGPIHALGPGAGGRPGPRRRGPAGA